MASKALPIQIWMDQLFRCMVGRLFFQINFLKKGTKFCAHLTRPIFWPCSSHILKIQFGSGFSKTSTKPTKASLPVQAEHTMQASNPLSVPSYVVFSTFRKFEKSDQNWFEFVCVQHFYKNMINLQSSINFALKVELGFDKKG